MTCPSSINMAAATRVYKPTYRDRLQNNISSNDLNGNSKKINVGNFVFNSKNDIKIYLLNIRIRNGNRRIFLTCLSQHVLFGGFVLGFDLHVPLPECGWHRD